MSFGVSRNIIFIFLPYEINRKPPIKWELIRLLQLIFYFVPFNSVSDKPHFLPIAQCERVTSELWDLCPLHGSELREDDYGSLRSRSWATSRVPPPRPHLRVSPLTPQSHTSS